MDQQKKNRLFFGLGTIGRDMFYTTVATYLIYYLTDILDLPDATMWWMALILTVLRVFDALNDPIMGMIVDNTNSRFGKFKPMIVLGAVLGAVFMVPMFMDFGLGQTAYLLLFTFLYLGWDIFYGANDIAYWSMLPALSVHPKERERIGAFARICANIGMYLVVVGILPVTGILTKALGSAKQAWTVFAIGTAALMILFQMFTVFGVKEQRSAFRQEEKTSLRDFWDLLVKNDQLRITIISMGLFMIGYTTTTAFGVHFFKYAFGNEGMYPVFAGVLGVAQLSALMVFPLFSKRFERRKLYSWSMILVFLGYIGFFLSPMNMLPLGISGFLIFTGQAFIQLLMLMFLADCVEYGQWKLGRRQESLTFSFQPLINKIGGAASSGIVTVTLILSGINAAQSADMVTKEGILLMKSAMLLLPLACLLISFFIYLKYYRIDAELHHKILQELINKGEIKENVQ
ncbi:MAG: glycoside-pentoside-hexuronide (GPH):cation symporter [Bacillota bacterium]|nr:glycoside-pentoside-hexuronide (GPH):cation symporter [Bacillota bacterium]